MLEFIVLYALVALAIANITIILTESDLMDGFRLWVSMIHPCLQKLATCKYCQSLWLSAVAGMLAPSMAWPMLAPSIPWPLQFLVTWFSLHLVVYFIHSKHDRIASDAPVPIYAMIQEMEKKSGDGEEVGK